MSRRSNNMGNCNAFPGEVECQIMSCQKLSCRFHVADVVSCCCMKRTSKQLYPDDDIELVHLERTSFSVKEHEGLMGIKAIKA